MSDLMEGFKEIARIGAAVGLSTGALIGCAVLAWFVASARPLAIAAAVAVAMGLGGFLYGTHTEHAAVTAQWAAADAKAAAAAKARDTDTAKTVSAKFDPLISQRDKAIADLQTQVTAYEKKIATRKDGSCALGAAALRLRHR